jgi:hypothetical protein
LPLCRFPHSPTDVAQPGPTYFEPQSVSRSPEMLHQSTSQQVVLWPAQTEYKYEYVSYPGTHIEAAVASGYYYSPLFTGHHDRGLYSTYSINSPLTTRQNSSVLSIPTSSNPSSGTTSSQFNLLETRYKYGRIDSTNGTRALPTPIMPTALHPLHIPTGLLLSQSGMTPEPMYPSYQQAGFQPQLAHHEVNSASYVPLNPISPVLEHPLAANQVVPNASTPATATPHSINFIVESEHQEEEEEDSPELTRSQVLAAEKLKKLRQRRYVLACTYCRRRKVWFCLQFIVLEHAC